MGSVLHSLRHVPVPPTEPFSQTRADCFGKKARTRADAERHAEWLSRRGGNATVVPYRCVKCGGWHVGRRSLK